MLTSRAVPADASAPINVDVLFAGGGGTAPPAPAGGKRTGDERHEEVNPIPCILSPKRKTLNPEPSTLNPELQTVDPQP